MSILYHRSMVAEVPAVPPQRTDPDDRSAHIGDHAMCWSPRWVVQPGRAAVLLSAGTDRAVEIDGLRDDTVAAVAEWAIGTIRPISGEQLVVLDRLVELGVVVPTIDTGARTEVIGDEVAAQLGRLVDDVRTARRTSATCALVVRTGATWPTGPNGLHLGIDLSTDHTVAIGPLVVPGASTCLDCLDGRMRGRWGDPIVPARPGIVEHLPVVAHIVAIQLDLVARGTSPLVNATMAWDLEHGETSRQSVYKMPGCTVCARAVPGPVMVGSRR